MSRFVVLKTVLADLTGDLGENGTLEVFDLVINLDAIAHIRRDRTINGRRPAAVIEMTSGRSEIYVLGELEDVVRKLADGIE